MGQNVYIITIVALNSTIVITEINKLSFYGVALGIVPV